MTTLYIDGNKVSTLYVDGKKVQLGAQVPQYLTIEPLHSEQLSNDTYVVIKNTDSASLSGTFEAKLNDNDWTTISWEDVSHGIDYNLVKACDTSKEYLEEGDKLQLRNIDKWSSKLGESTWTQLKITHQNGGKRARVYGKLADSLTPEFAASDRAYKLHRMFSDSTVLADASGLDLDGITIAYYCYLRMFAGCTSLVKAPKLPATTLALYCYLSMFYKCTGLASQDINLPSTALAYSCYNAMFTDAGTATTKKVHVPESLSSEVTASTFGRNTGVTVIHDL